MLQLCITTLLLILEFELLNLLNKGKKIMIPEKESFIFRFINRFIDPKTGYEISKLVMLIIFMIFMIQSSLYSFQYRIITWFNQSIIIVVPYSNDTDINHMKSNFAQIKNKDDFLRIKNQIEQIAKKENISLPDLKI